MDERKTLCGDWSGPGGRLYTERVPEGLFGVWDRKALANEIGPALPPPRQRVLFAGEHF